MTRNRLAEETSPYLLQHKDNPVHWRPWGPDALTEAKSTGKPILLSIGYAACHWCHVMAHESFEDQQTADVMNELFVNVKVDREERPDVDAVYMGALHRLGEQGGWPLTMFLDGDGRPFFGGTYFPRESRYGRPAFVEVLRTIARIYRDEPDKVEHNAAAILRDLEAETRTRQSEQRIAITNAMQKDLAERMVKAVDMQHGGVSGAPKFPQWSFFWLMWRGAIRFGLEAPKQAVLTTLTNICQGGIYDHLGGGFARYSVDEIWLVPHFEKMLYDNALLLDLLTEAWRETHDPLYAQRIAETVQWLEREMIAEGGGFAASLDADSEGEEGRFYVWSQGEILKALDPTDAELFCQVYDVSAEGNWEGKTILNRLDHKAMLTDEQERRLAEIRNTLRAVRDTRVRPGWDDKVLADWNGLMIAALARAGEVFGQPDWIALARKAFAFVIDNMIVDGRLKHASRLGRCTAPGTASDHANLTWAALRLHQVTGEPDYLAQAEALTLSLNQHHWRDDSARYATAADDTTDVIVRLATGTDDATPNANAIQVTNLAALTLLTGNLDYVRQAATIVDGFGPDLAGNLIGHTGLLAAEYDLSRPQVIAIFNVGWLTTPSLDKSVRPESAGALIHALHGASLPGALEFIIDGRPETLPVALRGKEDATGGEPTAFICIGPQCSPPLKSPDGLLESLRDLRQQDASLKQNTSQKAVDPES